MITFILLITVVFVLVASGFAICNSRPRKLYEIKWKCVMGTTHFDVVKAKDQPDAYRRCGIFNQPGDFSRFQEDAVKYFPAY